MKKTIVVLIFLCIKSILTYSQAMLWENMDNAFGLDHNGKIHAFRTQSLLNSQPFIAAYASVPLCDKKIVFDTDTTTNRRLTPTQFYVKNDQPTIVVNGTFFSFTTNENLNLVIDDGQILANGNYSISRKDTAIFFHPLQSAIGITKKRKADVAWVFSDKNGDEAYASQSSLPLIKNESSTIQLQEFNSALSKQKKKLSQWEMSTAIGGGPVLLQEGKIDISNEEEWKFAGKAIHDKHPRTAMGYTYDDRLIILVIQGRSLDASGASLIELAKIMQDLNCKEAINLDGGGSTSLLINGKEAIKSSDAAGQRAIPAVFLVREKKKN